MTALRTIRAARHMTLHEVTMATGIPADRLSRIERGLVQPTAADLTKIASALGVEEAVLVLPPEQVIAAARAVAVEPDGETATPR